MHLNKRLKPDTRPSSFYWNILPVNLILHARQNQGAINEKINLDYTLIIIKEGYKENALLINKTCCFVKGFNLYKFQQGASEIVFFFSFTARFYVLPF